ncbi:MAG: S9 family peptidase [Salinivirgaceae bacterium]
MKRKLFVFLFSLLGISLFSQNIEKKGITLSDLYQTYSFYPKTVKGLQSMNDGQHYTALVGDSVLIKYSYKTGEPVATLVSVSDFNNPQIQEIQSYIFNSDETKLIFYINREDIYRHSFTADYFVWDFEIHKLLPVSLNGSQRLATLSPDGAQVAFVRNNNLFISDLATSAEKQITTDGEFNKIINGAPDWVYEEEFEYNQAFAWSPDGNYLAYCKFNETEVPVFNMTLYAGLEPKIEKNGLYPENYEFKYPKAGEKNSVVTVHSYQIKSGETVKVDVGPEPDQYIPRLKWSPTGEMVVYRLNRLQNKLEFLYADAKTGKSMVFYTEENSRYIDEGYFDDLTFINNGLQFIYSSERDGFAHLYLHAANGTLISQVTKGAWDVTDYLGFDAKNKLVYYQSAESAATQRDIFVIKADGSGKRKLSTQYGTNRALFSSSYTYYINYFSNDTTPTLVTLHDAKGKLLRVLEDNATLKEKLKGYKFSPKEFFNYTTSGGITLNGWMMKPVDFDSTKKYPVLMTQYSGPNSQQVLDRFRVDWEQVLTDKGYIVACVDGRGTGGRGEEFRKMTYLQMGKYETLDQIETAKYLGGLSFIDSTRIGIWGWSYGGFMVLNCMTQGADYFKTGIAVAPVTNWRYYDNIYTERFMRTPQENPTGYDENSPISYSNKLKGNLLICHGTADDNVHVQNTLEISEAFVQSDKQFDMFVFTNRNHFLQGGNTYYYVYVKMLDYIQTNL